MNWDTGHFLICILGESHRRRRMVIATAQRVVTIPRTAFRRRYWRTFGPVIGAQCYRGHYDD